MLLGGLWRLMVAWGDHWGLSGDLGRPLWAAFGVSWLLLAAIRGPQLTFGGALRRSGKPLGDPLGRNPFLNAIREA